MCAGRKTEELELANQTSNLKELKIANEQIFIETVIKQWEIMVWTWKCGI